MKTGRYPLATLLLLSGISSGMSPFAATRQAPVVVTATRLAETADQTLSAVTVITREAIERSQAATLSDLLLGTSGVDVTRQGGPGQLTSLFMRGTNSGHVSVLVDGIRMGSVTSGAMSWEFIPLQQIERIEIVRGPNSALYGSDAIGGVIQIFTRRGKGPARWGIQAGGGRYNTRELAVDASGSRDRHWFSARAARQDTDGFDARKPADEFGDLLDEPDDDGHDNNSISLRAGHRFADGTELEFHGLHVEGSLEYDSNANNEEDFLEQVLGVSLSTSPGDFWDLTLNAGRSRDEREDFGASAPGSRTRFDSERRTVSLQGDYARSEDHIVSLGIEYHDDRVDGTTEYDETSRYTGAVFAQYLGELGRHSLLARLRPIEDEQFGSHTTGNIAWGYQASDTTRLVASYGTAFKAPTFNDLYFPGFSNPNLKPEESGTLEFGLQGQRGATHWDVHAFHTRIEDLIVFSLASFLPDNVNTAEINGLEASLSGTLAGWQTQAAITVLDPRDEDSGNILPRRAKRSFKLEVDRSFGRAELGATFLAQSARYDDKANTVRLAGYGLLNLRAAWSVNPHWQLYGRIENLLDKDYETVATYHTAERGLYLGVRYNSGG